MTKGRLEAFSDAVIAIIITIMVLELRPPHEATAEGLRPLVPIFASYVLSFVYLAIYWNNHHHMLQGASHIRGNVLWANMHLLFWLSLVPFATAWLGERGIAQAPVATYGVVMLGAALAYFLLQGVLVRVHGRESGFAQALGRDVKGKSSVALYLAAVLLAFVAPIVSCAIYVLVALVWLVPDRRFESS